MAGPSWSTSSSSSRPRSSSPFGGYRKQASSSFSSSIYNNSSSYSSSSPSPFMNGRRSSPASVSSHFGGGGGGMPRASTPSRGRSDHGRGLGGRVAHSPEEELAVELNGASRSGDSILVTVRFRPLSEREFQRGDAISWYADGEKMVRSEYNPATAYAFDRVFGPATNSLAVYNVAAQPIVKVAMEGINGTIFAYGVTSSGKTHTMHGDHISPGIIPLAIKDVFSIIQNTPGREFLLRVTYLEIYNEVINDLLDPTGQNLRVREDTQGTYVEGIKEEVVLSPGHALSFIAAGEEHRHVGSNNFNLFSSRSHTIFSLMIESSARGDEYDGVIFSQLNLIDLAGSESSKTETTGMRRKEGSYINKSLLTLGTVIGKLSEGKASHVPYRDSKLTRLLQSSLSGHGHVSLICTVTPASSNVEETHNTLKFASRAKRVKIYASRNRIIDEKSLIKKYQREISSLKEELDQLKRGIVVSVNQDEITSLRQQLEEGQVKMQSRLEEEEEAKAALMSRIQRLTKLILVSTKNSLNDLPNSNQRDPSMCEDDMGPLVDVKHQGFSTKLNEELSSVCGSITESIQVGDHIGGFANDYKLPKMGIQTTDHMDLLAEQVKMLAGEIALCTSNLKRLEQSTEESDDSKSQHIQKLEHEIQEKKKQMSILEQQITQSREGITASASLVDMQQTVMRLMTQCNEKTFELEIKTADNRILQEQLHQKCSENKELQGKLLELQQLLDSMNVEKTTKSPEEASSEERDELSKRQTLEVDKQKPSNEHVELAEQNRILLARYQKSSEEASYAKELASAAAVELKNLAEEVTKLSLQNEKLEKELVVAQGMAYPKPGFAGSGKLVESKNDATKLSRKHRPAVNGDADCWNTDLENLKIELQTRKEREANLEAALAEKGLVEKEYRRKFEEFRKKEATLENDLANMWVLVSKLKGGAADVHELNVVHEVPGDGLQDINVEYVCGGEVLKELQPSNALIDQNIGSVADQKSEFEPLLVRLKAKIQAMKEKESDAASAITGTDGEANGHHVCKVCFESPAAAVLLPCRHFCLCKHCSLACSECPLCRTKISNRIITFTS